MKRLFNFIVILVTFLCWISCENLVEEEGPIEYSKPSSVEVSASNSRESLDITLTAKPNGQSVKSVASASFAYSLSEDLSNPTTVSAIADGDTFAATFRTQDYGKRLYYQATLVNALGAQMTSSVENILIPTFSEFLNVSAPELVELTSSNITLKSDYKSPEGVAIAERGFCWSSEWSEPGMDHGNYITVSAYKSSNDCPAKPNDYQGYYDWTIQSFYPPQGWADNTENLKGSIWQTKRIYYEDGTSGSWTTPTLFDWNGSNLMSHTIKIYCAASLDEYGNEIAPQKPIGGEYDFENKRLTPPQGWNESSAGLVGTIYMTYGNFYSDGSFSGWAEPSKWVNFDSILSSYSVSNSWNSSKSVNFIVDYDHVVASEEFVATITGLAPQQTLYVKTYLIDAFGNIAYSGTTWFTTDHVHVSAIELNKASLKLFEGQSETITATVTPSDADNTTIFWSSSNSGVATVSNGIVTAVTAGSATITATSDDGKKTAVCKVTVVDETVVEYVDLGLSVKWGTCNLGAVQPEYHGNYYQWAGTKDVTQTSLTLGWDNTPYHTGSKSRTGWTKYIPSNKLSYWSGPGISDNRTILSPEDDVAHVKLGRKWRIPTDEEWMELRENCTWTWETVNGILGHRVTSRKPGYTNVSIFLPAVGYRSSDYLVSFGSFGFYWSASLDLEQPDNAHSVVFNSDSIYRNYFYRYYGLSVRPVYGDVVKEIHVSSVSLNKTTLSLEESQSETLTATVSPSNATNKGVSWKSSNSSVATVDANGKVTAVKAGTATITVTTSDGGKTATCTITVTSPSSGSAEYVDLGLSVKWATCNLGASQPEEYGGYYQWAGTKDVTSTSIYLEWSNVPFHNGSSYYSGWTKYVPSGMTSFWSGSGNPDNMTVLEPEDDAAHVVLGGKWRMPTDAEWTELRENCTWIWITVNGINGFRVTSEKPGYTDKSIFLPATGYRHLAYLYNVGTSGYYWSSSLSTGDPSQAWEVGISMGLDSRSRAGRDLGHSIRPVSE